MCEAKSKLEAAKVEAALKSAKEKEEENKANSMEFDFDSFEVEEIDVLNSDSAMLQKKNSVIEDDINSQDVSDAFSGMAECFVQMDFKIDDLKYPGPYPTGIRIDKREQYLPPAIFKTTFGMSVDEFNGLKKWRQQAKKKELGLW